MNDSTAWIFVSHSSADLPKVRRVRNYLEDQGTAPLLFHLRSLSQPEEFWPVIEHEIAARNFFLLCESVAARNSPWVQRERDTVRQVATSKAIRVGHVDLDLPEIDFNSLDRFLLNTRVFFVGDESTYPAQKVLESFGYEMVGGVNFSREGLLRLGEGTQMCDDMIDQLYHGASRGWLLVALSEPTLESDNFWRELPEPSSANRVMFLLPSHLAAAASQRRIPKELLVEVTRSPEDALREAAVRMLKGGPDGNAA